MGRFLSLLAAFAAAAVLCAAALSLSSRGHAVTLPLDDAYIYLQYARTAASGETGSYFPGEPPSSGATSLLWTALLKASALAMGARSEARDGALPAAALLWNGLCCGVTLWLAGRLARRHGAGRAGAVTAPLLLVLSPYWLLAAFNGMETGLFMTTLLGGAWTLAGGSLWWLVPLALTRPEGSVLALAILAARVVGPGGEPGKTARGIADSRGARSVSPVGRSPKGREAGAPSARTTGAREARRAIPGLARDDIPPIAATVLAAALVLALPWILTSAPSATWTAKAMWTEPRVDVRDFYLSRYAYFAARTLAFGWSGATPQPPLDLAHAFLRFDMWPMWVRAAFLFGGSILAIAQRRARGPLALWIAVSLLAQLAVAWDAQFYRYLLAGYPLLAVVAAAGWFGARRGIQVAGAALLLVILMSSVAGSDATWTRFRRLYRGECEKMDATQARVGAWIHANLPAGARVATHDVGAIAFTGRRATTDLVGLTTPELTNAYRHGEGALWEALSRLPRARRPDHAAVIPAWMPYLARTTWFGAPLWSLGDGARTGPVGQAFEVRRLAWPDEDRTAWPDGDFGDRPALTAFAEATMGYRLVDGVDVADLASEREHGYAQGGAWTETVVRDLGFAGDEAAARGQHAMEGGRDVAGDARFTLRARPGREGLLVLRSASARPTRLTVRIGGWAETLDVPAGESLYREPAALVPAEAVTDTTLTFAVEAGDLPYRAFHWWLLQTE